MKRHSGTLVVLAMFVVGGAVLWAFFAAPRNTFEAATQPTTTRR